MSRARTGTLVAVDGVDGSAILAGARKVLFPIQRAVRGGVSRWDASGIFEEMTVAEVHAGTPSARTLLLLYAADLAFRLRWEIRPALAESRTVVAAPYVDTAVAFGRAAGLAAPWLKALFQFAPLPATRYVVDGAGARGKSGREGFVEFGCEHWAAAIGLKRRHVQDRVAAYLRAAQRGRRVTVLDQPHEPDSPNRRRRAPSRRAR